MRRAVDAFKRLARAIELVAEEEEESKGESE